MAIPDNLDLTKDKVIVENNAQSIFDHIKELENEPKNRLRWIWELLQNAQDTVIDGELVNVEIIWDKDLVFSHDGKPFTEEDITHLIFHGSSKKEKEGKTGKFGTGFMTTHLISKKVRIEGQLDENFFDFVLDRTGEDAKATAVTLNKSWDNFKASIPVTLKKEKTIFTYIELSEPASKTVEEVLDRAEKLIPYVLAFTDKIASITIKKINDPAKVYRREVVNKGYIKITETSDNVENENSYTLIIKDFPNKSGCIALPLDNEMRIVRLEDYIPRIFITFPLIGTEKIFQFPFLIHSEEFEPSREREKLWLNSTTKETETNKAILSVAFKTYLELVDTILSDNTVNGNMHLLAYLGENKEIEWVDRDWYFSEMLMLINELDEKAVLETIDNTHVSINEALIPCPSDWKRGVEEINDVWQLSAIIEPGKTPVQIHSDYWAKLISNRETFVANHKSAFTLEKVCQYIENNWKRIDEFEGKNLLPLNFIQQLIDSIEKYDEGFYNHYCILPNQDGLLMKAGDLKQEKVGTADEIGEILKDIAHKVGKPIRSILLDENIKINSEDYKLAPLTRLSVIAELLQIVRGEDPDIQDAVWIEGTIDLLRWIVQQERFNDLAGFPIRMLNGKWDKFQHGRQEPFLGPVPIWKEELRKYFDLFPSEFIIADEYLPVFDKETLLNKITAEKWILKEPLYQKDTDIEKKELLLLINRQVDKETLSTYEDSQWKVNGTTSLSHIAYLDAPKDKNIIDKVRGSNKRTTQFLIFIVETLTSLDSYGFTSKEINIIDDNNNTNSINIYPSFWLMRLKERDWVKSQGSNTSERPSAETFLPYFRDNIQLYQSLQQYSTSIFLHYLGIGVGDLLRNIRAGGDEEERMQWDQSYVTILMNRSLTPQKVTGMLSDPRFLEEYEYKRKLEEKVAQNQLVGAQIEQAFNEVFELTPGFKPIRKPIGQDYEIECDYEHSLLIRKSDDKMQNFLIEIKSARSKEVRMTLTQGSVACNTQERYILCVVPVDGEISSQTIKNNARFVTNIPELLKEKVERIQKISDLQNQATDISDSASHLIRTSIEGTQIRYVIYEDVWLAERPLVFSFEEFVNGLIK